MLIVLGLLFQVAEPSADSSLMHRSGRVPRAITAVRTNAPPTIDGRLDDPIWAQITPEKSFRRDVPSDGNPASQETEVRIAYDQTALYVGARLYDDRPGTISRRLNRRDSFSTFNDAFFVLLDSYHDHRTTFVFGVTASGERRDAITTNDGDGGLDGGYDPVWAAATSIDSLGWVAEMRIPFSQLRFSGAAEQVWGIQLRRDNVRGGEAVDWQWSSKNEPGQASKFGHLLGLKNIPAPKRLEFLPYTSSQAQFTQGVAPGNPFNDGSTGSFTGGLDAKYGITSDLTLNATINPDFGQVEADPSVVNLTAFETFFEERRPFFVEGSNIFGFNTGFGRDQLFYSRRIGRMPGQSAFGSAAFVDEPGSSSILGALKLSGRTKSGWSIGVLDAVTGREEARIANLGGPTTTVPIEPGANYGVVRLKRDFAGGSSGYGFMGTAVNRNGTAADFPNLTKSAYVGAADFFHRWKQNSHQISGSFGFSRIAGPREAIAGAQLASARYYQRPDQDYVSFDPAATTLAGTNGQLLVEKLGGSWTYQVGGNFTSPGFELNDAGFQQEADRIRFAGLFTRQWVSPGKLGRSGSVSLQTTQLYNFGGVRLAPQTGLGVILSRHNFHTIYLNFDYRFKGLDDRTTRGGPLLNGPSNFRGSLHYVTDARKTISTTIGTSIGVDDDRSSSASVFAQINVQNQGRITFQITPSYQRSRFRSFYLGQYADPTATATFGNRYLFAPLDQDVLGISTRLNYYFTPSLSLQLYAQPFVATADFRSPSSLVQPRSYAFRHYGAGGSTVATDPANGATTIDADGAGPSPSYTYGNQDFRIRSIRSNLVLRWEYRPGSTVFLVWNQSRFNAGSDPRFRPFRDLGDIFSDDMQNVLLVKANYYFSF